MSTLGEGIDIKNSTMASRVKDNISGKNNLPAIMVEEQSTGAVPSEGSTNPVDSHANVSTTSQQTPPQLEVTTTPQSNGNISRTDDVPLQLEEITTTSSSNSTTVHVHEHSQQVVTKEHTEVPKAHRNMIAELPKLLLSMKYLLWASIVLTITSILVFTSDNLNGPLARIGQTNSLLVLNIMGILNGLALKTGIDVGFDSLQWGPLLARGMYLDAFWGMNSSTGPAAWMYILFRNLQQLKRLCNKCFGCFKVRAGRYGALSVDQHKSRHQARGWSFLRLVFFFLVQFPSIILLAKIDPTLDYFPIKWTPVSGGIGRFDSESSRSKLANGLILSGLVANMHTDTAVTFVQPPAGTDCAKSSSCISFIIPGSLGTVSPWPFRKNNDSSLSVYATRNTPIYQVDFWDASYGKGWAVADCRIYGVSSLAFQLCIDMKDNTIRAGWRACNGDVTSDGQCTFEGGWESQPIWTTWVSIYRRNATIFADRKTSQILEVTDPGTPEKQETIKAENFTVVFNGMLYPWKNTSQVPSTEPEWLLTLSLASSLRTSGVVPLFSEPTDRLRNLFMAPLWAYNPIISGKGVNSTLAIDTMQPTLHPENYINGSFARPIYHLNIAPWTKQVYVAVGSFQILLAVVVVLICWFLGSAQETSEFLVVDFMTLTTTEPKRDREVGPLEEVEGVEKKFATCKVGDNKGIMGAANGVKVYPRPTVTPSVRVDHE